VLGARAVIEPAANAIARYKLQLAPLDRLSYFVQRAPDFSLRDGQTKIIPRELGKFYRAKRIDGEQLWLADPDTGIEGWASSQSVMPLIAAAAYFSREIEAQPQNAFLYLMRAVVYSYEGDSIHALVDVNHALQLNPRCTEALCVRAELYLDSGEVQRMRADLDQAIEIKPGSQTALFVRGCMYLKMKNYTAALQDLDRAIEVVPKSAILLMARARVCCDKWDFDQAVAGFNRAIQIDPALSDAYAGLTEVYLRRSELELALAAVNKAIDIEPKNDETHALRARVLVGQGMFDKALTDLNQAIRLDPKCGSHHRERGVLWFRKAEFDNALADLCTSIRLDPNSSEAHLRLAWILVSCPVARLRDANGALASATRACELNSWTSPSYLATLAAANSENGDFASAVKLQQMAIDKLGGVDVDDPPCASFREILIAYRAKLPYHTFGRCDAIAPRDKN
jgi:tetratricopeptide (TPR) repeat protein